MVVLCKLVRLRIEVFIEVSGKKKSHQFTVVVRREFPMTVEKIYAAWTNPEIRRSVLGHNRYKNGVKEVDVSEGGFERYEDRWKNRLFATTTRRYVLLRPARMIIAHSETRLHVDMSDQHFVTQELLLFKPKNELCEIVASNQCICLEPTFVHSAEDGLNTWFDLFAAQL